ncbi:MAG: hypothetical protein JEZ14_02075 [Marinilabiliaceae bacterium]|nr:hypothetical protein [Marinilabiliaceae bacterium]
MKTILQTPQYCLGLMCQSSIYAFITQFSVLHNCTIQETSPISFSTNKHATLQSQRFTGNIGCENTEISIIPVNLMICQCFSLPPGIDILIILSSDGQESVDSLKHILKNIDPVKGVFQLPISIRKKIAYLYSCSSPMKMRKIAVN